MNLEGRKREPRAREVEHFVVGGGHGRGVDLWAVVGWRWWVEGATFTESRASETQPASERCLALARQEIYLPRESNPLLL
jgi:hypothetical protein